MVPLVAHPLTFAWRLQGVLGHPVRFAALTAMLVGLPIGLVPNDTVRTTVLGEPVGRVALLVSLGAVIGAVGAQLISALRSQASMDALTGLYDRRFMDV